MFFFVSVSSSSSPFQVVVRFFLACLVVRFSFEVVLSWLVWLVLVGSEKKKKKKKSNKQTNREPHTTPYHITTSHSTSHHHII
jgi:cell division protein FtsI/penicillin-binding protein 2